MPLNVVECTSAHPGFGAQTYHIWQWIRVTNQRLSHTRAQLADQYLTHEATLKRRKAKLQDIKEVQGEL